jgi:two-component system phosphate regulon sensor histidine kinase PhoR
MNRFNFRVTVTLMSFALAGLIGLQSYWINHDLQIREQQFDQMVMQALNSIVERVEQQEDMKIVVHNYLSTTDTTALSDTLSENLYQQLDNLARQVPPLPPTPPGLSGINEVSERIKEKVRQIRERNQDQRIEGKQFITIDSSVNIRIEKDIQQKEIVSVNVTDENQLFDSIARETERRMELKFKRLNTMMQRLTFQIGERSQNILERIPPQTLDTIIKSELINHEVKLDYNFGISKNEHGTYLYSKPGTDTNKLLQANYKITIFPNDIFKRNEQLVIGFPQKFNYLVLGMWPMIVSSIVFTLIMLLGFVYVMKVILKQKKIAAIKSDFINNKTHEFKTPIATIAIANESIKNPKVFNDQTKMEYYTGVIKDENQRMLHQVETVLQMAQIDKGELKMQFSNVDLKDIVQHAIGSAQLAILQREGKIELIWNAENFTINGDGNHLLNVFTNLLDNANKYSPDSPMIKIESFSDDLNCSIKITDHGVGMTKDTQRRVFDTFFRATTGNIHDVKGFGLGLSYVKAIIEQHKGSVSVYSELGKGSTFTVSLPIAKTN